MIDVVWLIQDSGFDFEHVERLVKALRAEHIPYHTVGLRPFDNTFHGLDDLDLENKLVIPYGSTRFVQLAKLAGFSTYHEAGSFHVQTWGSMLYDRMFNHPQQLIHLPNLKARSGPYFIRPLSDFKLFAGQTIVTPEDLEHLIAFNQMTGRETVAITCVKPIHQEVRVFVVGSHAVSASQYRLDGKFAHERMDPEQFQDYVGPWEPHDNYVMDMARESPDSDWKILEFNTLNCSGFYDHDIQAIVKAVTLYESGPRGYNKFNHELGVPIPSVRLCGHSHEAV